MVQSNTPPPIRKIFLNNQPKNHKQSLDHHYCSTNEITTAKYPGFKIVYKPLIEFFCIVANIYFLIISILQLFTNLSPESNRFVTAAPLIIIFFVSLIRKGLEDWHRKKADHEQNYAPAYVLDPNSRTLTQKPCKELKIGDIIKVSYQQPVPADLLLLATSESEGNCSVETSNLDGETNLKRKEVHKLLAEIIGYRKNDSSKPVDEKVLVSSLLSLQGVLDYEGSTNNLYSFTATLNINEKVIPLNLDHVIWRCCSLKNCDYVYGLVIYIGNDTRSMKNTRDPPLKQSLLYKKSNWLIIIVFILELLIIILSTIFSYIFFNNADTHWYLNLERNKGSWTIIFTFLILYNNFVPISLYVSLDFVKYFQARLMENDQNMFDEENGIPMMVRTAEICENLGQIDYIFTDKTGTLTRNVMELKKFYTGNMSYGFLDEEIARNHYRLCTRENTHFILDKTVSFRDPKYKEDIINQSDEQSNILFDFMKCLALCHTVVPEFKENKIGYRASSPDEEAFVKAARALGFSVFVRGKSVSIEVSACKKNYTLHYEIMCINEFDSNRKRMSIIIKDYNDEEKIWLLCKGADSEIIPFLSKESIDNDLEKINVNTKSFASMGLRTLVFTKRQLSQEEYDNWIKEFDEANNSFIDRICKLSDVASKIEKDLIFVGITAIEDRLQEGVSDCVENLTIAGIKIWLITGDKIETAINVAQSCNLLLPTMRYYIISELRAEDIRKQICEIEAYMKHKKSTEQYGIVIGGASLSLILKDPRASGTTLKRPELNFQSRYLNCCKNARCVIACRVSPAQKAQLVDLVRFGLPSHPITLGIGDGANDVNMIQSSHVGVGIVGKEGLQAVNNSDFAIGQFRFLNYLLLVHGKDAYRRVCGVILYSFYKNIALVLTIFFFQFFTGQSGATFYDSILKLSYNFFLAIPIIVFGSIDTQCKPRTSIKYPQLYKFGRKGKGLCVRELLLWMLEAILHGAVPFVGGYFLMETIWGDDGQMDGISLYGTGVYTAVFIIMNVKMAYMNHIWNWCFQVSYWGSIILYFVFATIYSATLSPQSAYYRVSVKIWTRPRFYLMVLLIVSTSMLIDYTVLMYRRFFRPFPIEVCQEYDRRMKEKKVESRRSTLESELLDVI